jgi:hypothetical protein
MAASPATVGSADAFDYGMLSREVASAGRRSAARIRRYDKKSIKAVIHVGNEFIAVKAALPYGQYLRWLRTEPGPAGRTERNYRRVAWWLGPRLASIAILNIQPTAAYLLAARSVPDLAREAALTRAKKGVMITTPVARGIIAVTRKTLGIRVKPPSAARLRSQLARSLSNYARHWPTTEFRRLRHELLEHVDSQLRAQRSAGG